MEETTIYFSDIPAPVTPMPDGMNRYSHICFPVGDDIPCKLHKIKVSGDRFVMVFRSGPYRTVDGFVSKARYTQKESTLSEHMEWIKFLVQNGESVSDLPDFIYSHSGRTYFKDKEYLLKLSTKLGNFLSSKDVILLSTYIDLDVTPSKVIPQGTIKFI